VPRTVPLLGIRGDLYDGVPRASSAATRTSSCDPSAGTLARIPWYDTPVAQVLTAYAEAGGGLEWIDPRSPLLRVLERYARTAAPRGGHGAGVLPAGRRRRPAAGAPDRPHVPGHRPAPDRYPVLHARRSLRLRRFLDEVRIACDLQGVPLTAMHSEFSPGQWEINTHHQDDAVRAGDHALLLRRIVKAWRVVTASAPRSWPSPLPICSAAGMHIHASVYERDGRNVFADPEPVDPPRLMPALRHAVAGLATRSTGHGDLCAESQFLPALQGRRLRAGSVRAGATITARWPCACRAHPRTTGASNTVSRVPTPTPTWCWPPCWRVSTPACSAGVIRGSRCRARRTCRTMRSPCRRAWTGPSPCSGRATSFPITWGPRFVGAYAAVRQGESDDYHGQVPDLDYAWYLRAL
jgi:glutamine synthetase